MADTTRARVCIKPAFGTKRGVQKVTLLRFSIWLAFFTFLTAMALHWSGYNGGFASGRTVYRVTISTGEIAVERAHVVARK